MSARVWGLALVLAGWSTLVACSADTAFPNAQLLCNPEKSECPSGYLCVRSGTRDVCCKNGECGPNTVKTIADAASVDVEAPADGAEASTEFGDAASDGRGGVDAPGPNDAMSVAGPDGSSCQISCTVGTDKTCGSGGGVRTCINDEKSGCPAWGPEELCSGTRTCKGSEPGAKCTCPAPPPGCEKGAGAYCKDAQTLETCAMGADGCITKGTSTMCPTGKPCSGAHPTASCSCATPPSDCAAGAGTKCVGTAVLNCAVDALGCLAVANMTECPAAAPCSGMAPNASCTCNSTCSMSQLGKYCKDGKTLATCAASTGTPTCYTSSAEAACPGAQICAGAPGSAACQCPSGCTLNDRRCGAGGGVQTCVMDDTTKCPGWGAEAACPGGQSCSGSAPAAGCGCPSPSMMVGGGCSSVGSSVCLAGAIATCTMGSSCASWVSTGGGAPAAPGPITGPSSVCGGQSGVTFSVPALAGASSYAWTYSGGAGFTVASGSGASAITALFASNASSGSLTATATNACGTGPASAPLAITVGTVPAAPTALAPTGVSQSSLMASWTVSAGATSYEIDVATDMAFSSLVSGNAARDVGNATALSITGLSAATSYFYRVRAKSACGASPSSNTIGAMTTPAPKFWGSPVLVESGSMGASNPGVALDGTGNAVAVWTQASMPGFPVAWGNRFTASTGWGTAVILDNHFIVDSPRVQMDGSGNALAVWRNEIGLYQILSARYVVGSGWSSILPMQNSGSIDTSYPSFALNSSGTALGAWKEFDNNSRSVGARLLPSMGWSAPTPLFATTMGSGPAEVRVAIDSAGNGMAVWTLSTASRSDVWSSRYTAGVGWGTPVLAEMIDTGSASSPQIAADGSGNFVAVWVLAEMPNRIWANRWVSGSGWGTATRIQSLNSGDAATPTLAVDANGNAIVVWSQLSSSKKNIWANRFVPGSGWGVAQTIESQEAGDAVAPQIGLDGKPNADAVVVWTMSDGTRDNIWANRFVSGAWAGETLVENNNAGPARAPAVGVAPNGNAMAVWAHSDGSVDSIWSSQLR